MKRTAVSGNSPSGTVTFLFTDIEGSTQRWERDRTAMQEAVRRHDAILRRSIEARGGLVFKTIGDAFCAAFSSSQEAVGAALDAQRTLAAEDFSVVEGVRVRMALHSGTADERDDDYFGPTVNRVARLLAIGHGGQVLLSGACGDAVRPHLAQGLSLLDVGRHRLKDLAEPEFVHQLQAPDLPHEFPPLSSLDNLRHNVPQQLTSFVGRADEFAEVKALLGAHRLVTLVGTGGVGKTRLALQVGADLIDEMADGTWFVQFAPIVDPSLVTGAIASVLGLQESLNRPMIETLITYLKHKRTLLILDNCEHLVADIANAAAAILENCPNVTILATTREPLHIPGEYAYRVPTLAIPQAVALFAERASEANPHFTLTEENASVVEGICRHLDGIALAIELAAARVNMLPVEKIAQRLGKRFRLLTGNSRTALPRQQTLHALIDWSYELLSEQEKWIFAQLAAFVGGATLETLTATCADDQLDEFSLLEIATSLVDKSLLVADEHEAGQRYRFLESIRAYASERLDGSDGAPAVRRRYAQTFAGIADRAYEEFDTEPKPDWLERYELEMDNARSALTWALGLGNDPDLAASIAGGFGVVFLRKSLLREGIEWCERALVGGSPLDTAVEAQAQYVLSMLFNNQMRYDDALAAAQAALGAYRQSGDRRGTTRALSQVAHKLETTGQRSAAIAVSEEALDAARRLGDRAVLAAVLARCASVFASQDIEQARSRYAESAGLYRELGREVDRARVLYWWAVEEHASGDRHLATKLVEEALTSANDEIRMWAMSLAMSAYWLLDERDRAIPATREALLLSKQNGHEILLCDAISYVAMIAAESDASEAVRLFGYAERRQAELGWIPPIPESAFLTEFRFSLRERLGESDFSALLAGGAAWSAEQALAQATKL